jgi:hypothetical protein
MSVAAVWWVRACGAFAVVLSVGRAAQAQEVAPPPPPQAATGTQTPPVSEVITVRPISSPAAEPAPVSAAQQRVLLQLDSHEPSLPIFRAVAGGGVRRLCDTPCVLQVVPGPFDFSTDAAGRDLRVINVPASGLQMYVDAESAGGLAAPRVDGRSVTGPQTVSYDGHGRDVGIALMVLGGGLAVPAMIGGPGSLIAYASTPRPVSGRSDSTLLYVGIGVTSFGLLSLGVSGLGYYFTVQNTRRTAPRVAVVPTLMGIAVGGAF